MIGRGMDNIMDNRRLTGGKSTLGNFFFFLGGFQKTKGRIDCYQISSRREFVKVNII